MGYWRVLAFGRSCCPPFEAGTLRPLCISGLGLPMAQFSPLLLLFIKKVALNDLVISIEDLHS